MTGWIDPLGLNALYHFIESEQGRLAAIIEQRDVLHPKSKTTARLRGRRGELGRMMTLIQALQRPGAELQPYKELVNQPDRPDIVRQIAASVGRSGRGDDDE